MGVGEAPFKITLGPNIEENIMVEEDLEHIWAKYHITRSFVLELVDPFVLVTSPRENQVSLYEKNLKAGLRLPVSSIIGKLLNQYQLA